MVVSMAEHLETNKGMEDLCPQEGNQVLEVQHHLPIENRLRQTKEHRLNLPVYLIPVNLPQVIIRPHNNNNIGSKMMIGDVHPSSIETEDGKEKICRREVTKDVISTTDVTIKITDLYLLAMQGVEAITEEVQVFEEDQKEVVEEVHLEVSQLGVEAQGDLMNQSNLKGSLILKAPMLNLTKRKLNES